MKNEKGVNPLVVEAIEKVEAFIVQTTGEAPTPREISDALTRYFVLKEILDFIVMSREENKASPPIDGQ